MLRGKLLKILILVEQCHLQGKFCSMKLFELNLLFLSCITSSHSWF